jgi:hypothetical protein
MIKRLLLIAVIGFASITSTAQDKVYVSGSIQSDMLFPQEDEEIGTGKVTDNFLSNTYLTLALGSKFVDAGTRLELLTKPLPGFEAKYAGAGLPNIYVTGKYKNNTLTLGNFYEQFGSGLIFRTYEERSLGIDNSLRGARLVLKPYKGINFKLLGGLQRVYWNYGRDNAWGFDFSQGAVWGSDLELNINEWLPKLQEKDWNILVGTSFVSRYEPDEDIYRTLEQRLNLPRNVAAGDFRIQLQHGNWGVLAEYALIANNPSLDNNYIYKNGSAILLSGTYSQKGMSALLQIKRSDNMSYRSARSPQTKTGAFINHLPAFTQTHTYALAALYPYATQPAGEWAFQGGVGYTFKKGTKMGGKYGTTFKLNASYVFGLDKTPVKFDIDGIRYDMDGYNPIGSNGYTTPFFGFGETYYTDLNLELSKKFSKKFSLTATYMFQKYNKRVIEGKGDLINSHIGVAELKYQFSSNVSLRGELQYLHTRQDEGDWAFVLVEASLFQNLMVFAQDMYNLGETNLHYYNGGLTYNVRSHRFQLAYGRTRAGYNCSGGVCRWVPAFKGVQISYNMTF